MICPKFKAIKIEEDGVVEGRGCEMLSHIRGEFFETDIG
jgi:hypothetical protein